MKLNIKSLFLSSGIILALITLIISIWYSTTGFSENLMVMLMDMYGNVVVISHGEGFFKNLLNILLITIFSFVDGGLIGLGFGFLYNLLIPKSEPNNNVKKEEAASEE